MEDRQKLKIPFVVKLCSDKAAFEVRIQRKISFNMADLERLLRSVKENEIIVDTPHIVIFRSKGAEVTLSRNGRMLIKKVRDEKKLRQLLVKFCVLRQRRCSKLRVLLRPLSLG